MYEIPIKVCCLGAIFSKCFTTTVLPRKFSSHGPTFISSDMYCNVNVNWFHMKCIVFTYLLFAEIGTVILFFFPGDQSGWLV